MKNIITIGLIQKRIAEGVPLGRLDEPTARRLWWAALDTLQNEILMPMNLTKGIWLASPLPALYEPKLLERLKGWVWTPDELENLYPQNIGLLPPSRIRSLNNRPDSPSINFNRLPLRKEDGNDPLLIFIAPQIQVALSLQGDSKQRRLLIRSDGETLHAVLNLLDLRLKQEDSHFAKDLREALAELGQLQTNNDFSGTFWPLVSERLAGVAPSLNIQTLPERSTQGIEDFGRDNGDISLLEAITHEVRTPLATIRTLIRSLLRKNELSNEVIKRLRQIDSECTEQIDRFGLIFKAAELERSQIKNSGLAKTDLGNMLQIMYPIWHQQLDRRGVQLHLDIETDLPQVLSDPEQLELMLGGLIDRNSRGLKSGGTLILELRPAGQRLKLKIFSKFKTLDNNNVQDNNSDLGTVLSWNPSTGSLQLSQGATQRLFASLGGRLTHQRDSGLTIFFPIAESK